MCDDKNMKYSSPYYFFSFFFSSLIQLLLAEGLSSNGRAADASFKHNNNARPLIKGFIDLDVIRVN